ncbi:MAG: Gfo/Idh/MocA family oxidoreductase [Spirochaetes bacterium]|nr:Gfo/Idh/MocA family oxidoreductase [Spirochaetota bacterium]
MAAKKIRTSFQTSKKPVGWAVVGLGMGKHHANLIMKSPGLKLAAICDGNRELLDKHTKDFPAGTAMYTTIDELLADKNVEGVSLVIPHDLHAPMAMKCLKAGRHVVLDKPFCLTVSDGKKMIALARVERRLLSAFHNRRWDVDYVTLQKLVDSGRLGKVRYLESRISSPGPIGAWRWRANRRQMGGLLYDWGAHLIDQSLKLIPSLPVSVYGWMQRDTPVKPGHDIEDRMQALIQFEDGAAALVAWTMATPAPFPRFIVEFEKGGVRIDDLIQSYPDKEEDRNRIIMHTHDNNAPVKHKTELLPYVKAEWVQYYQNIGAALTGKAKLIVKPEEAIRHVAICEAAYKSVQSGKAERLPRTLFV